MCVRTPIPLTCTYDSAADAAYIYLGRPTGSGGGLRAKVIATSAGMLNLDLDVAGHVVGLEVIGARKQLPPDLLQAILDQEQTHYEVS
jgi:uncharacterized protein YuzE